MNEPPIIPPEIAPALPASPRGNVVGRLGSLLSFLALGMMALLALFRPG